MDTIQIKNTIIYIQLDTKGQLFLIKVVSNQRNAVFPLYAIELTGALHTNHKFSLG